MKLVIQRNAYRGNEKDVRIQQGGNRWYIDPQRKLKAVGIQLTRDNCVVSFTQGIKDAGMDVWMETISNGNQVSMEHFIPQQSVVVAYYILGLAWGKDQWKELSFALMRFPEERRLNILEETGKHFLRMWYRPERLYLVVPI